MFYARSIAFPRRWFLNDGVPEPKTTGTTILFRKMTFSILGARDFSSGCN